MERSSRPDRERPQALKITFVYPDETEVDPDWTGYFYYGIALLSSVLKQLGHETSLIHIVRMDYTDEDDMD